MWLLAGEVGTDDYMCPPLIVILLNGRLRLTITYRQFTYTHIYGYTQGSFNNHTDHMSYRIQDLGNQCHGEGDENGKYCT